MLDGTERPVLLAYDGSEGAARAIETAGAILHGGPAVVAVVWRPLSSFLLLVVPSPAG
jgi:hypothetical protein